MVTAKSPGRRARDPGYVHDIGVVGRQTGLELAPRPRDEHGLEIPEGLFSPTPGKPKARKTPRPSNATNGTMTSSESMQIAESSAPEPTSVLQTRVRETASRLSIPHSRSPMKTNLGQTPLRGSIGALSPIRPQSSTGQLLSQSPHKRKLIFDPHEGRQSPYSATRKSDGVHAALNGRTPIRPLPPRDVYEMPRSSPIRQYPPLAPSMDDEPDLPNGLPEPEYDMETQDDNLGGGLADEDNQLEEDQLVIEEEEEELAAPGLTEDYTEPPQERRESGRQSKRKSMEYSPAPQAEMVDPSLVDEEPSYSVEEGEQIQSAEEVHQDQSAEEEDAVTMEPPAKKRAVKAAKNATKKKKSVLATADRNRRAVNREKPVTANSGFRDVDRPKATQRMRHQTPAEEDGISHSRYGRAVIKPLQYWKGERLVYEPAVRLPAVMEVLRVDDVTPVKRARNQPTNTRKKRKQHNVFEEDVDDDQEEPWEIEEGEQRAPVRFWDAELGIPIPDEEEDQVIAFSGARITPRAAPDNPTFLFTKLLTTDFFGSGMIELPPGGSKGLKNSRKFHFMFFVASGKVSVEVAGTRFAISRGGMWQVPRGNVYAISNENETHTARIFFAQSCEVPIQSREPASMQELQDEE